LLKVDKALGFRGFALAARESNLSKTAEKIMRGMERRDSICHPFDKPFDRPFDRLRRHLRMHSGQVLSHRGEIPSTSE
jgi:hypothetical protein